MRAKFWGCRHSESNNSRLLEKTNIAGLYHSPHAPLSNSDALAVDKTHRRPARRILA
jgi:hypothetical protein